MITYNLGQVVVSPNLNYSTAAAAAAAADVY
jgi:hypothetical protein